MESLEFNPNPVRKQGAFINLLQNIWKGRLAYFLLIPLLFFYGLFVLYP